jgi:helicase SWR1
LELQPQSKTRQTRAAAHKVEESKGTSARHSYGGSLNHTKFEKGVDRRTLSAVKPAQSGPGRPSSLREQLKSPSLRRHDSSKVDVSPIQTSKTTPTKHFLDAKDDNWPQQQHPVKQYKSPTKARTQLHPLSPKNSDPFSNLNKKIETQPRGADDEVKEEGAAQNLPKIGLQKIKFTVRMPPVVVQSPANIPQPRKYSSFREFLDHDELEPKTGEGILTSRQVVKEAQVRKRVRFAQRLGKRFDKELQQALPERQKEPNRQYFHHDHLLAHTLHFRKLLQAEHQKHKSDAKRIAHEAAKSVRVRIPKSAEEIEQEQIDLEASKYRLIVKDISRFWASVEGEVNKIRQAEIDALDQAQKMREFNEQVEKHTQMLAPKMEGDVLGVPDEDEQLADSTEDGESSDDGNEDNMSSSDSSSEVDGNTEDADAYLTAEQLRTKYASLPRAREQSTDNDRAIHTGTELPQPGAQVSEPVALEQVDDALLDDDSESIDTDDGEDSDADSSDGSGTDEESDEDDEEPPTLRSLFGPADLNDAPNLAPGSSVDHTENHALDEDALSLRREHTQPTVPGAASQMPLAQSTSLMHKPTSMSPPGIEFLIDDHNSIGPSTPASPHTSITKASDGDSFTSSDARADSQRPATPLKSNPSRIKTPVPSLLRGTLREYQHEGLDWLANLYSNHRNGILADEMGLGKTIQSIALLAHLAVEHHVWGPHLIIVPSSVILNWEMEFKKFCPGFKILTYYGNQAERAQKRKGWMDNDLWHVVVTSYQLVVQDQKNFKRRNWHYMILDEAHNIKNFRSQRWQTMLTFKTRARLLLTGTPLQNNLTELWSLLFFLRPTDMAEDEDEAFAGLSDFSDWFRKPVDQILDQGRDTMDDEARDQVSKLHKVIRPYLLRRLKADVEKQMPSKYEHVELCRLSKRQRQLYDGFMSMTKTRETLASGNYLSIINCLMQLRKVCNHPDLFETRPVTTSFTVSKPAVAEFEINDFLVRRKLQGNWDQKANLDFLRLAPFSDERKSAIEVLESSRLMATSQLEALRIQQQKRIGLVKQHPRASINGALASLENIGRQARMAELEHCLYQEYFQHCGKPIYGIGLLSQLSIEPRSRTLSSHLEEKGLSRFWESSMPSDKLDLVQSVQDRAACMQPFIQRFGCVTPAVVASGLASKFLTEDGVAVVRGSRDLHHSDPFHESRTRLSIAFPDKRLLQYDCGKLQRLDKLLRELQAGGHRALIFTQMTKVLDILEQFLNIHGHRYLRLDGSTKIEQRQILTERFNNDTQFLAFILSSRSGGLGINLTGADTVIFYDLDWNPAMDKQCQDRCHRIGQTRDVHIYRFVSEHTIESNILRKSNQKRMLDDVVIQEGDFTTDYFNKLSVRDMLGDDIGGIDQDASAALDKVLGSAKGGLGAVLEEAEDKEDVVAAKLAEREDRHADDGDFDDKVISHEASATPRTTGAQTPREDPMEDSTSKKGVGRVPYLDRAIRDLDEWVLEFMMQWKNEELGEIRAETLATAARDRRWKKKKKAGEHRVKRAR